MPLGIFRPRSEDNIKLGLIETELKGVSEIYVALDRVQRRTLGNFFIEELLAFQGLCSMELVS
jgi:hypothetical protein